MSWYKQAASGPLRTEIVGPNKNFVGIFNSFDIKDQLKRITDRSGKPVFEWGQRYDPNLYAWIARIQTLADNPDVVNAVEALGVTDIRQFLPGYQPPAPVAPQPQVQTTTTTSPQHITEWLLGRTVRLGKERSGTPIALAQIYTSEGPWAWVWQTREGEQGIVQSQDIMDHYFEFLPSKEEPLSSVNPAELFSKFDEMAPELDEKDLEEDEREGKAPRGRIPPDMISKYQQQIEDVFLETEDPIVIDALAGTGKTTTLQHLASFRKPGERWAYIVFNAANASSALRKFPPGFTIATSHSFLLQQVLNPSAKADILPKTQPKPQDRKVFRMADELVSGFPPQLAYDAKMVIGSLVGKAKNNAVNPEDPNLVQIMRDLLVKYNLDVDFIMKHPQRDKYYNLILEEAAQLLRLSMPGAGPGKFGETKEFDDMLWWCAMLRDKLIWPHFDYVLVDEVQDFNQCQVIMLEELAKAGARIVAVGDPNQAIYMFRGANSDSFEQVRDIVAASSATGQASDQSTPLNFRSCRAIIDYVNKNSVVTNLEGNREEEGVVREGQDTESAVDGLVREYHQNGQKLTQPTAILSRINAPLREIALTLLKSDVQFKIVGSDLAKELKKLVTQVVSSDARKSGVRGPAARTHSIAIEDFGYALADYVSWRKRQMQGKASKADELKDLEEVSEALQHVISLLASMDYNDPAVAVKANRGKHNERVVQRVADTNHFSDYLEQKFGGTEGGEFEDEMERSDPHKYVILTSAHKSKGLEFDRTMVVGTREEFFSKKAETPEERQQEENAWYVALTRARDELHILRAPQKD